MLKIKQMFAGSLSQAMEINPRQTVKNVEIMHIRRSLIRTR